MSVFVDSSAVLAFLNPRDAVHEAAVRTMRELLEKREQLVTHSHALVEMVALVQRRLGVEAVVNLVSTIEPQMDVEWIDREAHDQAMAILLAARRRDVSLVDHVSFQFMRAKEIDTAFAFDRDFVEQGFTLIPERPES